MGEIQSEIRRENPKVRIKVKEMRREPPIQPRPQPIHENTQMVNDEEKEVNRILTKHEMVTEFHYLANIFHNQAGQRPILDGVV